jgi:hypothetical protein
VVSGEVNTIATTVRSRKARGRRFQQLIRDLLISKYPLLKEDISCTIMGETGVDIKLTPLAKTHIPFDIECKNTEKASVWEWIKQAEKNSVEGRVPLVAFTRNRSNNYALIRFEDLLRLLK